MSTTSRLSSLALIALAAACSSGEPATAPLRPDAPSAAMGQGNKGGKVPLPNLMLDAPTPWFNNGVSANYDLTVGNWQSYDDKLFAPAPKLPPCGLNTSASRSWVELYTADGTYRNGFCSLGGASDLQSVWVNVPVAQLPVDVYLVIWDRQLNRTYKSNLVTIPPLPNTGG